MKRGRRLEHVEQTLETINRKTDDQFVHDFLLIPHASRATWTPTWASPNTGVAYSLCLRQPCETLTSAELDACFSLVQATSQRDYEGSSRGWDPPAKRDEMRHPDLRYILVRDAHSVVRGFTSLMPTIEEGQPVVYCYEIHLEPELRGTGLARLLMDLLETVASNIDVADKVMLTVFTCNKRAVEFYQKCGFVRDGISPQPRTLRGGKVKVPEYQIMSKRVTHRRGTTTAADGDRTNGVAQRFVSSAYSKQHQGVGSSTGEPARPAKFARLDHPAETGL